MKNCFQRPFVPATAAYLKSIVFTREGETRLGERVHTLSTPEALSDCPAHYVLLGIPEDIGVRANYGVGGTHSLWEPSLRALLQTQESAACSGNDLLVLGAFHFGDWMAESEHMDAVQLRALVALVDEVVAPLMEAVFRAGKTPIILGGGHNNAYPLLKGLSQALGQPAHAINLDAHCDYRRKEGRHSGNPFRYAREAGFLDKYAMVGLHTAYNAENLLQEINADSGLHYSSYEAIFLEEKQSFQEAVSDAIAFTQGRPVGIELDLDCIAGVLASAATPCGLSPLQARQYLRQCMMQSRPAYVHLPEGAVWLRDGRQDLSTAKLAAYLIREVLSCK
ncbi:MAG: formimidoylglutamase [Bacteroidetes bacterium]|nr:formimidoylglutamase [Bacteroidota bacterium]